MALGDWEIKGKLKVGGTTELAGGAKDATLVTSLNADQVDSADKDTDGTLAANSDAKIPSQKAVKTYADNLAGAGRTTETIKGNADNIASLDSISVKNTGNETIAGVKTFSDIPLLPANTIETEDIQDSAVTGSKIGITYDSGGVKEVPAGAETLFSVAGIYMWVGSGDKWSIRLYQGGDYHTSGGYCSSGCFFLDGSNQVKFKNNDSVSQSIYYLKIA